MPNPEQNKWEEQIKKLKPQVLWFGNSKDWEDVTKKMQEFLDMAWEEQEPLIRQLLSQTRQEIIKQVEDLIVKEILICREENTPTSRLTSLFNKLEGLK